MIITRKDPFTGKTNTMDLDITEDQIEAWHAGQLVQNAFPKLNADQREFLMTGIMPDSWDAQFDYEANYWKRNTHGSPELDADARKLEALGQDPGPTLGDFDCPVCGLEGGH